MEPQRFPNGAHIEQKRTLRGRCFRLVENIVAAIIDGFHYILDVLGIDNLVKLMEQMRLVKSATNAAHFARHRKAAVF